MMPSIAASGVLEEPICGRFRSGTRRLLVSYVDGSPYGRTGFPSAEGRLSSTGWLACLAQPPNANNDDICRKRRRGFFSIAMTLCVEPGYNLALHQFARLIEMVADLHIGVNAEAIVDGGQQ